MSFIKKIVRDRCSTIVNLLAKIQSDYIANRYIFVDGKVMEGILRFFGATDLDMLVLRQSGDHLGDDPTLPFRKSRNGRFLIDSNTSTISRLEFQPFILSKEEEFVRADSDTLRHFRGIQDSVQLNSAFQALIKFQFCIIQDMRIKSRPNLETNFEKWVSTIFQLRTITTPELLGEPAKEGVHSDGVEHTMTTFIQSRNMSLDSAISRIHTRDQKTGIGWGDELHEYTIGEVQHRHFLDTLLIVDSELKHSVSSLNGLDETQEAIRDMIIFFTRRPKVLSHSSYKFDSLNPHIEIPISISVL